MTSPSEPAILKNPADIRARIQEAAGLSLDRLPMLQLIFDRLATACGDGLKHLASSSILYALGGVETGRFGEFLDAYDTKAVVGIFHAPAWDGHILVGLDRGPLRGDTSGARIVVGDVMSIDVAELLGGELTAFDVVLSDMAPDTSGVRHLDQMRSEALFERALEIATQVLAPGGNFVGKLFQGPDFKKLTEEVRAKFEVAKTAKPESSRQISIEQYVIGKGFKK